MTDYSTLSDEELSRRVAEALGGWRKVGDDDLWINDQRDDVLGVPPIYQGTPPYATDWSLTGPLIEEYEMAIGIVKSEESDRRGYAEAWSEKREYCAYDSTALRAICGAFLALKEAEHD